MRHLLRLACLLLVATLYAQDVQSGAPIETLKLNARVVLVPVAVHTAEGRFVHALTKEDFILREDGKKQSLPYLLQNASLPLTLILMVDTSGSQTRLVPDEIAASKLFFDTMLERPEDRASLVRFNNSNTVRLQEMTHSVSDLQRALGYLEHDPYPADGSGGTRMFDAICAAAQVVAGKEPGRRAIVMLTDGEDYGSRFTLKNAVEEAQRADVTIYSILYSEHWEAKHRSDDPLREPGDQVLAELSNSTGGRVFTVTTSTPLSSIYASIAEELRLGYQLGYTPPPSKPGKFHHIEVDVREKHLSIQARKGYYTPQ